MAFPSAATILTKLETNDAGFISELTVIIKAIGRKWHWSGHDEIDDVAQECYLKLLQNLRSGKFRGDSSFKTYLYAIIRNTCIDYYKRSKIVETIDIEKVALTDHSPSAEENMISRDKRKTACRQEDL